MKPETAYVAIHDGARPLLRPKTADRVIEAAFRTGAAAAGVHVKDTVKLTDENGVVTGTPDRRFLWNVQTPQVFELAATGGRCWRRRRSGGSIPTTAS